MSSAVKARDSDAKMKVQRGERKADHDEEDVKSGTFKTWGSRCRLSPKVCEKRSQKSQ